MLLALPVSRPYATPDVDPGTRILVGMYGRRVVSEAETRAACIMTSSRPSTGLMVLGVECGRGGPHSRCWTRVASDDAVQADTGPARGPGMVYVVRALWSRGECHSQRADLVQIKSIHCPSVKARPAVWDMGPPQPPNIKQDRTGQDSSAVIFRNNEEPALEMVLTGASNEKQQKRHRSELGRVWMGWTGVGWEMLLVLRLVKRRNNGGRGSRSEGLVSFQFHSGRCSVMAGQVYRLQQV